MIIMYTLYTDMHFTQTHNTSLTVSHTQQKLFQMFFSKSAEDKRRKKLKELRSQKLVVIGFSRMANSTCLCECPCTSIFVRANVWFTENKGICGKGFSKTIMLTYKPCHHFYRCSFGAKLV